MKACYLAFSCNAWLSGIAGKRWMAWAWPVVERLPLGRFSLARALASCSGDDLDHEPRELLRRQLALLAPSRQQRIVAESAYRIGYFRKAAEESEKAAREELCGCFRGEFLLFAALNRQRSGEYRAAFLLVETVLEELYSSTLSLVFCRRLWHHANFIAFSSLEKQGRLVDATSYLETAVLSERRRRRGPLLLLLGRTWMALGETERARRWLSKARGFRAQRADADELLSELS